MKHPLISLLGLVLADIAFVSPAMAVVNMNWTSIGNAGNAADTTGYGAVSYAYSIGTYDVTNAQYVDFLNAKGATNSNGIFSSTMATTGTYGSNITQSGVRGSFTYSVNSTYASMPVVGVTWFDAARFCNWLGNGQGSGDMETGAYTLAGAMTGVILANSGAVVRLPSDNEWYKAAYYNGTTSTYSLYPNGQNTITSADANYWPATTGLVNVDYGTASSYGTLGQGGNAAQWNDAVSGSSRGLRGGTWINKASALDSSHSEVNAPSTVSFSIGFRVASVPEPTSVALAMFASVMLLIRRQR